MHLLGVYLYVLVGAVADGARILCVFPMPSYSHHQVFRPIYRELSLRGHQVTVVTVYPLNDASLTNLTEIDVGPKVFPLLPELNIQPMVNIHRDSHVKIETMFRASYSFVEAMLADERFIKIYNATEDQRTKFDLLVAQTYINPTIYALAAKLDVPFVGISSMGAWIGSHYALGNPNHPALHSEMYLPYQGELSFWERFRMTLYNLWSRYYLNFVAWPECDRIARKYLGGGLPPISEIERNMSMMFLTQNHFLHLPRPTVPSIINIEHVHVEPPKALPKDLKDWLDSAKDGAVYFSLGSNVRSANTSKTLKDNLIQAFAELPYKFLWKFEADSLPELPPNVMTRKWLPQQDILAHPNVKVFFTQGGLQSAEEALDREVPLVVMPFISDQDLNTRRLVAEGVAVDLDYRTATKEDIKWAILEVAKNPKYKENMIRLKDLWLDHPMKSIDRVIWWMEYVIRHEGARHLRSPTADIPWIQYLLIDVIFVMLVIVLATIFVIVKLLKLLMSVLVGYQKRKRE